MKSFKPDKPYGIYYFMVGMEDYKLLFQSKNRDLAIEKAHGYQAESDNETTIYVIHQDSYVVWKGNGLRET